MLRGIFTSTFYVLEAPDIVIEDLDLQLTAQEQTIFDDIMLTETMEHLELEFAAVGNGLVWQKDHFEMIPNQTSAQCNVLKAHHKYFFTINCI